MDEKIETYLKETEELLEKCDLEFAGIEGSLRLKRKLEAEKKFLTSLKKRDSKAKEASLYCLNLIHLKAVVKQIESVENITAIFKSFKEKQNNYLTVDVVYDYGSKWVKVIARSPQALHFKVFCEYNDDTSKQAETYLATAQLHPCNYQVPQVLFNFSNGITQALYNSLEKYVFITGPIVPVDKILEEKLRLQEEEDYDTEDDDQPEALPTARLQTPTPAICDALESEFKDLILDNKPYGNLKKVNLDVSTLLALVSSLSNGDSYCQFDKDYLNQQAESERRTNLVPILEEFMRDKELYVCQTAYDSLNKIVYTVGGSQERLRYEKLKQRLKVVPDNPDKRVMQIKENKKVKHRTKIIFGTGENLQAITTTSNLHFVRASNSQGFNFTVYLHQPRALTEQKTEKMRLNRKQAFIK